MNHLELAELENEPMALDPAALKRNATRQELAEAILNSPAKRMDGELFETYKIRMRIRNTLIKAHRRGIFCATTHAT